MIDGRAVVVVVVVSRAVVAAVAAADQPAAAAGAGLVRAAGAKCAEDGITSLAEQKLLKLNSCNR